MFFEDLRRHISSRRLFDLDTLVRIGALDADTQRDRAARVRDLYRWRQGGKVIGWRRNLYSIAPRYGGPEIDPLELACAVHHPGYVSLGTALMHRGVLDPSRLETSGRDTTPGFGPRRAAMHIASLDPPEVVSVVGTGHSGTTATPLGEIRRHRIRPELLWGYTEVAAGGAAAGGAVRVALPHKALIDLWYLWPRGWTPYTYEALQLRVDLIDFDALDRALSTFAAPQSMRRSLHALLLFTGYIA